MYSETDKWCGQFERCKGCHLQSQCMVRPEELAIVFEDGKPVDLWAVRTRKMIMDELNKKPA